MGIEVIAMHPGALRGFNHQEAADRTRRWLATYGPRAADTGAVLALEPILRFCATTPGSTPCVMPRRR
jgi:hypothetical protein